MSTDNTASDAQAKAEEFVKENKSNLTTIAITAAVTLLLARGGNRRRLAKLAYEHSDKLEGVVKSAYSVGWNDAVAYRNYGTSLEDFLKTVVS